MIFEIWLKAFQGFKRENVVFPHALEDETFITPDLVASEEAKADAIKLSTFFVLTFQR